MIGLYRDDVNHDYVAIYPDDGIDLVIEANITGCIDALRKDALEWWMQNTAIEAALTNADIVASMVRSTPLVKASMRSHPAWKYLSSFGRHSSDVAKNIGTGIHSMADALSKGETPKAPEGIPDDLWRPMATNYYRRFIQRLRPVIKDSEFMVCSTKYMYAGTMDMAAEIKGELWLLDIKTSQKAINPRIESGFPYPDTALQLAAGRYADFIGRPDDPVQYPIPQATRYGVVAVTPTECELVEYAVTHETFRWFLAARKAWEWRRVGKAEARIGIVREAA